MSEVVKIPAPQGLSRRGRRFWREVVSTYKLRSDELVLLENACRCLDIIAELEAAMDGQPLLVKGSMGQERENPLLSETRLQRAQLNRTLAQLKLPDIDAPAVVNQHREAAVSRWARAHGGASG